MQQSMHVRFALAVLLASVTAFALSAAPAHAAPCTPPVANPVACENSLPGVDQDDWYVENPGDPTIQGYATSMSVNKGSSISFKVKSATTNYRVDILRLGYYDGDGARTWASNLAHPGPSTQPACVTSPSTGLIDCGNWSVSATWTVPSNAVSGVYIARLQRNDTGGASLIPFVVRDDASTSDVVVQTSDTTWQAYNIYGGNSLYQCTVDCPPGNPLAYKSAYKVSYNRPWDLSTDRGSELFTGAEYSMIRFIEEAGYDVSYVSGVDTHQRGSILQNHKIFISSGHDEYWSTSQRTAMENARAAGVNLAFFTGNEGFWRTRWENSAQGTGTQDRTLVAYKDTHFDGRVDPVTWTGTWRDSRFTTPSENVTPENALTGQSFIINSGTSRITVPWNYRNLRFWRHTDVASLSQGGTVTLAPKTLGYEWDADADNGFRPTGSFRLSSTTVSGVEAFTDYGSATDGNSTATHNMTIYRAPSGALVFGAGTVQWAWGLSDWNEGWQPADENMQQATVNLFADMGAQPDTLMPNLTATTASTDTAAPTASISSPPTSVADGASVTLSGTATDAGGGTVAGVEVSTDGGTTWHPASGTTSWTYTWIAHGHPSTVIKYRAVDDSGNLQTAGAGVTVNVTCPCSIWGVNTAPPSGSADGGDGSSAEVGVKFKSDKYGTISGIRFYKSAANTGSHIGSLWTEDGTRIAQATFSGESASGWQTVTFSQPVEVMPNTTYVASYFAPNGHFAATGSYFYPLPAPGPNGGSTVDSPPLHALRNTNGVTNGVYAYSATSTFPNSSYGAANYWVDVVFTAAPVPGTVTGVSATSGGLTSAYVSWTAPSSGGPATSYKITPYIGSTAQASTTVSGSNTTATVTGLTNGTTYRFTVQAVNPNGAGPQSAQSNAVTPLTAVVPAAPTNVTAEAGANAIRVKWSTPSADGDSAITGYVVTPYIGASAQPSTTVNGTGTSVTISDLVNGTAYTFRVAAVNAIGTGAQSTQSSATVPQGMLFPFTTPSSVDGGDANPVELGVKFKPQYDGAITGIRFYKASTNTGLHTGSLWSANGTRLSQVTFSNESASGWQTATFPSPIPVTAGTTYVASYFAPNGHYSTTTNAFATAVINGGLEAPANSSGGNGVYAYAASSSFPTQSYNATSYSVDVLYSVPPPGTVTGVTAVEAGQTSANVSWSAPATGGAPSSYVVTPYVGASAQTPKSVSGTATKTRVTGLTSGVTYRFTVQAKNASGVGTASALSNAVTPLHPVAPSEPTGVAADPATGSARVRWTLPEQDGDSALTGQTVTPYIGSTPQTPTQVSGTATSATVTGLTNGTAYTFRVTATNAAGTSPPSAPSAATTPRLTLFDFATPQTVDSGPDPAVTLGMKFQTDFPGTATGMRFYKATANTGTHTGALWSSTGAALAQVTFTNETASGWQYATFSSPVTLAADTTYVVGYQSPNGHFSTGGAFTASATNGPLRALQSSVTPNGVFNYGSSLGFPTSSFGSVNYYVDILFQPAGAPGTVTGVNATPGIGSVTVQWTAPSTGGPATSYRVTPYVGATAQPATTVTGTPPATSATIDGLTAGTAYTFRVQAVNPGGDGPQSDASNSVTPSSATAPAAPGGVAAAADLKSALVSWTPPASNGSPITGYTVTPYIGATAQTPVNVSAPANSASVPGLTPGTAYTFQVTATNAVGTSPASTPSAGVSPLASLLDFGTPATTDSGESDSVNLGVKFVPAVSGAIHGIRFYKAAANTGTHVGTLWSNAGSQLRQVTFTGESASGWQTARFTTPVEVTAGTTYVVSYLAPNGHYSLTGNAFSSALTNGQLTAPAMATTANGVYAYSSGTVFPTESWNASNYWVDVLFSAASGT